ncbi:MAG TPA: maleylpyruvate isomerase family mycothiol-dependent enzyme [Micromonospora sp.]
MERARFLHCLATDEARLRELAAQVPDAAVPSCPDWTMSDLVDHVAMVYLHKTVSMRTGQQATQPPELPLGGPLDHLDAAYAALTGEFAARRDDEPTATWYGPDQTVGFWVRRMAQETVIHRIDAELAAGAPIADIPDDLAVDGIDEVLVCFLAYASRQWPQAFESVLPAADLRVRIGVAGRTWLVLMSPSGVEVQPEPGALAADATVTGTPADVLRWLWRRADDSAVRVEGDPGAARLLHTAMSPATQ